MSITIELAIPDDRITRQDSAFYTGLAEPVATITTADKTRSITVECVGEMRAILWTSPDCDPVDANIVGILRTSDDFIRAGIIDDITLAAAEDRLEWENNSWFELFDSNDEGRHDFTEVYHEVDEAIQAAIDILSAE